MDCISVKYNGRRYVTKDILKETRERREICQKFDLPTYYRQTNYISVFRVIDRVCEINTIQ